MGFQLAVNALFFSALFLTDWSRSQKNFLRVGNHFFFPLSPPFRAGLVIFPPVSRRDCCCGVMLRARLGVNDIAWAARQALSSRPLISTNTEIVQRVWAMGGGGEVGGWQYQELWGAMTHFHCPLSCNVCEREPVAGITCVNLVAASMQFQMWRCETFPEASAIFPNIPLILLKMSQTLGSVGFSSLCCIVFTAIMLAQPQTQRTPQG